MSYELGLYIDGAPTDSTSGDSLEVLDPSTEEHLGSVPNANAADVDRAVEAAQKAFLGGWRLLPPPERSKFLWRYAALLTRDADGLAEVESRNTGKPLRSACAEVLRAARYFEYYAGAVDKFLGETHCMESGSFDFTLLEPLGVTAHILPWNFPMLVFARSVAPALATGNTVVVKPAEQAPLSITLAARLSVEAGFPPGVLNVVNGTGEQTGESLVTHPLVRSVAITGSVETGRRILKLAAERIVPVMPELGGKSPNIVFADADLESAADNAFTAIFANSGQTCLAGSRLLVDRRRKDDLLEALYCRIRKVKLGPGLENPDLGPLISREQRDRVERYLAIGRDEGARVAIGGGRPPHLPRGFFLEPTVLDSVRPDMCVAREEIFGPVLCVFPFASEAEALALANGTEFGLAAGVFTRDLGRAMRMARELDAGRIFINRYPFGDVSIPFGGKRQSGWARAGGMEALRHFTQVKSVSVHFTGDTA